ncbi:hypothetical protein D9M71_668920 [compost metagenome]
MSVREQVEHQLPDWMGAVVSGTGYAGDRRQATHRYCANSRLLLYLWAALAANTGEARAIHHIACFALMPAPTGSAVHQGRTQVTATSPASCHPAAFE